MWVIILFLLLLITFYLFLYFQSRTSYNKVLEQRCLKFSYWIPGGFRESADQTSFLFALGVNVYLSNCSNLGPLPNPFGYTQTKITNAYVFENEHNVIVIFTGTFYYYQWQLDLKFKLISGRDLRNSNNEVKIHQGFLSMYNEIKDELHQINIGNRQLYLSGISLGGALVSIAALDFAEYHPIVYTFASPRVFNIPGANLVNALVPNISRIYNTEDVITNLPPAVYGNQDFMHVGKNVPFTINLGSVVKNHTDAYRDKFLNNNMKN